MSSPQKKIIKVYDKDGQYKTMVVEQQTTSGEVCEKLGKKLFMNSGDVPLFNLYVFEGGVKQALKMTDFPFDIITKMDKKDYKFYFLNVQGEFMSFQNQVASSMTAAATQKQPGAQTNSATSPSYTSAAGASAQGSSPSSPLASPPMASVKPSAGMSGYLMRKKAGKFFKTWVVAKNRSLTFYPSEEAVIANEEPLLDLTLENAVIELKSSDQGPYILVTLANSERHTLMSENQGDLQAWATELAATSAYSTSQAYSAKVASPTMMAFIPTSKDLGGIKLNQKMENLETMSETLVAWTTYLVGRRAGLQHGDDITTCYSDGSVLANVLEALFNKRIKYRRGKSVYEMQYNIDAVLDTLKTLGADFGKLVASDIVECKVNRVIVRLIWSIFVAFVTNGEKEYVAKDRLMGWCGRRVQEANRGIIVDTPSALQNPLVFAALMHRDNAALINMDELSSRSRAEQAQEVLDKAHDHYGIPRLFSASRWQQDGDDKSFLIYLSFFYYRLSGEASDKAQLIDACREDKSCLEPETVVSSRERQLKSMRVDQQPAPATTSTTPAIATSAPTNTIVKPSAVKQAAGKPQQAVNKPAAPATVAKPAAVRQLQPQPQPQPKQEIYVAPVQPVHMEDEVEMPPPPPVVDDAIEMEKAAKRREAEERAEALAKQLELDMLQYENEDPELEERMRLEEEQEEMRQLDELERMQREEFQREQEAMSLQAQIAEQEAESQRALAEWENKRRLEAERESQRQQQLQLEQEEMEMVLALEQQERERKYELQRQQELQHLSTQSDELDKILRAEQRQQEERERQQKYQQQQQQQEAAMPKSNSLMDMFDQIESELSSVMTPHTHQNSPSHGHVEKQAAVSRSASPTPVDSSRSSISHEDNMSEPESQQEELPRSPSPPASGEQESRGRVVVRICLEGFGDVLFCSFAIGYDTLCGTVRKMVVKKMKVPADMEEHYLLYIVRDGLERILEDEEILLEAEDRVDRFVYKLSEERQEMLLSHRGQ